MEGRGCDEGHEAHIAKLFLLTNVKRDLRFDLIIITVVCSGSFDVKSKTAEGIVTDWLS